MGYTDTLLLLFYSVSTMCRSCPVLIAVSPALDSNVYFMYIYGTNDRSISINNVGILDSELRTEKGPLNFRYVLTHG